MIIDIHQDLVALLYPFDNTPPLPLEEFLRISTDDLARWGAHLSLPAMQSVGVRVVVGALFPLRKKGSSWSYKNAAARIERQFCIYSKLADRKVGVHLIKTRRELLSIVRPVRGKHATQPRKVGLVLSLEGCDGIELFHLRTLIKKGVRIVGLSWNLKNKYAGGLWSDSGLSDDGVKLIKELDRRGCALDLVHLNAKSRNAALDNFGGKVLISHTALAAYSRHLQTVDFATIEEIVRRGGLIGFAFLRTFYSQDRRRVEKVATLEKFLNELQLFKKRFGTENCALGSDLGGFPYSMGLTNAKDVADFTSIANGLKGLGWTEAEIDSFMYRNALDFLSDILPS